MHENACVGRRRRLIRPRIEPWDMADEHLEMVGVLEGDLLQLREAGREGGAESAALLGMYQHVVRGDPEGRGGKQEQVGLEPDCMDRTVPQNGGRP